MLNLSEQTVGYIETTFNEVMKPIIYNTFSMLETFGVSFYEDKYVDLLYREFSIDSSERQDMFMSMLREDVFAILNEHAVTLDLEQEPNLTELNYIAKGLLMFQTQEDYRPLLYILNNETSDKEKFIAVIHTLTDFSVYRLMELIESVGENLIPSMLQFAKDSQVEDAPEQFDKVWLVHVAKFFKFIGETPCLGLELFTSGYVNLELSEMIDLLPYELDSKIKPNITLNAPQAALDVLSVLLVTKDNYTKPLEKLDEHLYTFFSDLNEVSRIKPIIVTMVTDFSNYLLAHKQVEAVQ